MEPNRMVTNQLQRQHPSQRNKTYIIKSPHGGDFIFVQNIVIDESELAKEFQNMLACF